MFVIALVKPLVLPCRVCLWDWHIILFPIIILLLIVHVGSIVFHWLGLIRIPRLCLIVVIAKDKGGYLLIIVIVLVGVPFIRVVPF
jgi:hypothetical protein